MFRGLFCLEYKVSVGIEKLDRKRVLNINEVKNNGLVGSEMTNAFNSPYQSSQSIFSVLAKTSMCMKT